MGTFWKTIEGFLAVIGGIVLYVFGWIKKAVKWLFHVLVIALIVSVLVGLMLSAYVFGVGSGCTTGNPLSVPAPEDAEKSAIQWCVQNTTQRHKLIVDRYTSVLFN